MLVTVHRAASKCFQSLLSQFNSTAELCNKSVSIKGDKVQNGFKKYGKCFFINIF